MTIRSSFKNYFYLMAVVAVLTSCASSGPGGGEHSVKPPPPTSSDLVATKGSTWYPIKSTGDTSSGQFSHRFYHAYPLDVENPDITQIIFVVHGASGSQGDYTGNYFDRVFDALEFEKLSDGSSLRSRTQIIGPHFRSLDKDVDECDAGDSVACLNYIADNFDADQQLVFAHGGWREGASTTSNIERARVSSFQIASDILTDMFGLYTNLRRVIITGHSAGGQFVNRYAAAADFRVDGIDYEDRYEFLFLLANPSSVFYIDTRRPNRIDAPTTDFVVPNGELLPSGMDILVQNLEDSLCETEDDQKVSPTEFDAYADTYNDWKYGLDPDSFKCPGGEEGFNTHCSIRQLQLSEVSDRVDNNLPEFVQYLIHNVKSRRTVFLAGDADIVQNGNLDDSCEANLLGIDRFVRAQNYALYWDEFDDWDNSILEVLKGVAHSGEDVYRNPSTNGVFLRYVREGAL